MPITPLPTPPSTLRPDPFANEMDTFLAALPVFADEMDALGAISALGTSSTSTTSLTFGTGSKTLTVGINKGYTVGIDVVIASTVTPTNRMIGTVTAYTSATGELTVEVYTSVGTGTLTAWTLSATLTIDSSQFVMNTGTASALTFNDGYTEEVYAVTGTTPALSPTNGSIQTWTLTGNSTPTAGTWAAGQSITLMIDDGTAYTITWSSVAVTWKTDAGVAPTLNTSGYTAIALWKVGTTIYGARVGNA